MAYSSHVRRMWNFNPEMTWKCDPGFPKFWPGSLEIDPVFFNWVTISGNKVTFWETRSHFGKPGNILGNQVTFLGNYTTNLGKQDTILGGDDPFSNFWSFPCWNFTFCRHDESNNSLELISFVKNTENSFNCHFYVLGDVVVL